MIHHVSLECHRRDAGAHGAFWPALGFAEVDPPASLRDRAAWWQAGATQIHLLWADAPVVPAQGHVAVQVADLDATLGALAAAGFATERRTEHWGEPRAYAHAPGGHTVELFAVAPQSQS